MWWMRRSSWSAIKMARSTRRSCTRTESCSARHGRDEEARNYPCSHLPKHDSAFFHHAFDHVSILELAFEHFQRKRIENEFLDGTLERTCAKDRIITFVGDLAHCV